MNINRRISPICLKCKQQNTYDIIPEVPNIPEYQLNEAEFMGLHTFTVGNAKYYCIDCGHTWKKYKGKERYNRIKVIHADVGGFPGPYFNVKIDLELMKVEKESSIIECPTENIRSSHPLTKEEIEWFRSELYKCDLVNWAEEYMIYALDGTHWDIRIEYDTYCEIKTGSNHFPLKWTKFCKALSKLSGSEFY
ncbi:hypothetical protein ABEY24_20605 [Peribacillus frigoritolerans]|uniref:hypothetical protein n=1 Tax=Peribacillus frigoritolerans TaxID=450367 RepID=UPI003D26A3A6